MNEADATQHCVSDGERGASNAEDRESQIEWKPYQMQKEQSSTCKEEEDWQTVWLTRRKVFLIWKSTTFVAD